MSGQVELGMAAVNYMSLYWSLVFSLTNPLLHVFSSIYKDSNTLHLPTERFSPVRRFSDGAASIQAFKAHLEKMGNNSSIKQLQQVKDGAGGPGTACARAL